MTKNEAIIAMQQGKKVTHEFFSAEEWMKASGNFAYEFEDGIVCSDNEFWHFRSGVEWEAGWSIFE